MNWWIDFALGVLLLAFIPFALAAYGGHVAADAITDDHKRRAVKLTFWGMAFFGLFVAIVYQYRIMGTDDARQVQTQNFQKDVNARLDQIINHPVSTEQQRQATQLKQSVEAANPASPSLPKTLYGNVQESKRSFEDQGIRQNMVRQLSVLSQEILDFAQERLKGEQALPAVDPSLPTGKSNRPYILREEYFAQTKGKFHFNHYEFRCVQLMQALSNRTDLADEVTAVKNWCQQLPQDSIGLKSLSANLAKLAQEVEEPPK